MSSTRARAVAFLESRGLCGLDEEGHAALVDELRAAFDAAERRGKIDGLEWALQRTIVWNDPGPGLDIRDELARLRAEEGK